MCYTFATCYTSSKREFFRSLHEADLGDNKKFWGVVKALFSNKVASNEKISRREWQHCRNR